MDMGKENPQKKLPAQPARPVQNGGAKGSTNHDPLRPVQGTQRPPYRPMPPRAGQGQNQRPTLTSSASKAPQVGATAADKRQTVNAKAAQTNSPRRPLPSSNAAAKPPQEKRRVPVSSQTQSAPEQNVQYAAPKKKWNWRDLPILSKMIQKRNRILESERNREENTENLVRVRGGIDRPMLVLILVLLCYGSVMVFSASYAFALSDVGDSYYYIRRQVIFVLLGLFGMVVVANIDYKIIQKLTPLVFLGCLALMGMVLVAGVSRGDAQRWIYIGPISIQASEPMKLGLVMVLAWYYHKADRLVSTKLFWRSSLFGTFIPILIVGVVCGLILLEKHFSGTIIMFAIGMAVIFAAGGKWLWFGVGMGAFGGAIYYLIMATDYASKRIDIWLNPQNYSTQGEVWQTLQGLYAIGSGGVLGVGLGNSTQKHLFVSEPQNDFIYSIICEEMGLLGAMLVIGLFLAFVWRGLRIAQYTPDVFSRLTVIGIVCHVGIQAFLNIAVVTGTIPNTGITLPFFSYGGSSLTILLMEMGILLSISRYSYQQK